MAGVLLGQAIRIFAATRKDEDGRELKGRWASPGVRCKNRVGSLPAQIARASDPAMAGAPGFTIFQNVSSGRDPQLAILYPVIVLALAFMGGGRFSLDAK